MLPDLDAASMHKGVANRDDDMLRSFNNGSCTNGFLVETWLSPSPVHALIREGRLRERDIVYSNQVQERWTT